MPQVYRFRFKPPKMLRKRGALRGIARKVVNLKLVDFTQITNIQTVRPPVTPPGKGRFPKMNGKEKLVANLSLNFFLDARNISDLRRRLGKNISILDVSLVNSPTPKLKIPVASTALNMDDLMRDVDIQEGFVPVNINVEIDLDKISAAVKNPGQNIGGRTSKNLQFVFTLFKSAAKEGEKIGPPVVKSSYAVPYDMESDLQAYYTVRTPVKITAASTAIDQSLITLHKPANCNAEMVDVYRRQISSAGNAGKFQFVKRVDFAGETDTLPDEGYIEMLVDGNPTINPDVSTPPIDNVFRHQYRAVPVGKRGAPSLVFRDAFTTPISQADVSIGDNFRVLPILDGPPGSRNLRGYQLTDDNFLSPNEPMIDQTSNIAVVTYVGPETTGGVVVEATGLQNSVAIDFVRRDVSKNERKFTLIKSNRSATGGSPQRIIGAVTPGTSYTFTDTTVLDGHTYEYAIRSYNAIGVIQLSDDKSHITYRDPNLLPTEGISLVVDDTRLTENNNVEIEFTVNVPQNVASLLASLLNIRAGADTSPFTQDIIDQRRNLSAQPAPVIRRLNITSGEEISFKLMGNTAPKFESLDPPQEGAGLQNTFKFRFTDSDLDEGNQYRYEVLVNLRDPLSVTDEITSIVPRSREPYIFQSCKIFNPLFITRGILPPTARGKDLITQKNIETGRDRLLNRFSADDAWDLGVTAARQLVPEGTTIQIPTSGESMGNPSVQAGRVGGSSVRWKVSGGTGNIDHFKVYVEDTYIDGDGLRLTKRSLVATVAAQGKSVFHIESQLSRLREEDREQFLNQTMITIDMGDLQRLVDLHQVTVERVYEISSVKIDGKLGTAVRSAPIEIWNSIVGSVGSSEEVVTFSVPPNLVFEAGGKFARRRDFDVKKQAKIQLDVAGLLPRQPYNLNLEVARNFIIPDRNMENAPQVQIAPQRMGNMMQVQRDRQREENRMQVQAPPRNDVRPQPQQRRNFGENAPGMQAPPKQRNIRRNNLNPGDPPPPPRGRPQKMGWRWGA